MKVLLVVHEQQEVKLSYRSKLYYTLTCLCNIDDTFINYLCHVSSTDVQGTCSTEHYRLCSVPVRQRNAKDPFGDCMQFPMIPRVTKKGDHDKNNNCKVK